MAVDLAYAMTLPPEKAIEYFRSKGYTIGFHWQDVAAQTQARAFTVAGVLKTDILQDVRQAFDKQLTQGQTLAGFKRELMPVLERKGWLGKGLIVDEGTGEIEGKRLSPRRLETIFRTNMQSAYMAGRYASQMERIDTHPYWEYVAVLDNRTRPTHRALSGRVYRHDDPFWLTFYPPNGFRCRCRVRTRTRAYVEQNGVPVLDSHGRMVEVEIVDRSGRKTRALAYVDPVTGKKTMPDPGFGANPGTQWAKPFTPPPVSNLPQTLPPGASPPVPAAHTIKPDDRLPVGLPPTDYAQAFLKRLGGAPGKSAAFRDIAGDAVPVSDWLFKDGAGKWMSELTRLGPDLLLLAQAIEAPDEIWLMWAQIGERWELRRRYLRVLQDMAGRWGVAVFDLGKSGWAGQVEFPGMTAQAERHAYIDKLRGTFLRYQHHQRSTDDA
ncbi:phage minor head protein [Pandoraea apista]|uniref:phage minor head protein n=1 Tax=Pandoraea apista TaxID=93218 RepID=UPI000F6725A7|nr:phage minor head protein [Pandoraea apista]RRW89157.1 phage head morphogenesis protein [Pandoraea apista]RRW98951.1 phage head morphogenesis protein [Pandoraea apista]